MEGTIINFRMSRHSQDTRHIIITVPGIDKKEKAESLIGKEVSWKSPSGKILKGIVKASHGNSGAIRAIFEKGMPGQAIGKKVTLA